MELDGPFLTVFLPDMEIWAVVTINIEENALESGWLRLKDESQQGQAPDEVLLCTFVVSGQVGHFLKHRIH